MTELNMARGSVHFGCMFFLCKTESILHLDGLFIIYIVKFLNFKKLKLFKIWSDENAPYYYIASLFSKTECNGTK